MRAKTPVSFRAVTGFARVIPAVLSGLLVSVSCVAPASAQCVISSVPCPPTPPATPVYRPAPVYRPYYNPQPRGPSQEEIEQQRLNAQYDQTWSQAMSAFNNKNYALALQLYRAAQQLRDGPQVRGNIALIMGLMAWSSDIRVALRDFQERQGYLEQLGDDIPEKAQLEQSNEQLIDTLTKAIAAQDKAAQDARDRVAAGQQATRDVAALRAAATQRVAAAQAAQSAAAAAADDRVRAFLAGGGPSSLGTNKPGLVAPTASGGAFGIVANPSNPYLGSAAPPVQPVGAASAQLVGAASSGREAAVAPSPEDTKRWAECQFDTVGCGAAAAQPIAFPKSDPVGHAAALALQEKLNADPEYKRVTEDRDRAQAVATAAQQQLDTLTAAQQAETDPTKRQELQIQIHDATDQLKTAQSQIRTDDIKREERKKKIMDVYEIEGPGAAAQTGNPAASTATPGEK